MFNRRSLLSYALQMSSSTMLSRVLGVLREIIQVRYLGPLNPLSDALIAAVKVPSSLRKIFAEGALSAALVPALSRESQHKNKESINRFFTAAFVFFLAIVIVLSLVAGFYAQDVVKLLYPGFSQYQTINCALYLRILMPMIVCISASAMLAGVLHTAGHFFTPSFAPVLLNIFYIAGLLLCIRFGLSVNVLCWMITGGAIAQLIAHFFAWRYLGFFFTSVRISDFITIGSLIGTFFINCIGKGANEIGLYVDGWFSSFIPSAMSLLYYANRFMQLPLGIFGVTFATISLPYFSRVRYAFPSRMKFHLVESIKLILWIMIPATIIMMIVADDIFRTLFQSKNFTAYEVAYTASILRAYLVGLTFFSLNSLLVNVLYALHAPWIPVLTTIVATGVNIVGNMLLVKPLAAVGLGLATSISGIVHSMLLLTIITQWYQVPLSLKRLIHFCLGYSAQQVVCGMPSVGLYFGARWLVHFLSVPWQFFFMQSIGFWIIVAPLVLVYFVLLYRTRRVFGIKIYYVS